MQKQAKIKMNDFHTPKMGEAPLQLQSCEGKLSPLPPTGSRVPAKWSVCPPPKKKRSIGMIFYRYLPMNVATSHRRCQIGMIVLAFFEVQNFKKKSLESQILPVQHRFKTNFDTLKRSFFFHIKNRGTPGRRQAGHFFRSEFGLLPNNSGLNPVFNFGGRYLGLDLASASRPPPKSTAGSASGPSVLIRYRGNI